MAFIVQRKEKEETSLPKESIPFACNQSCCGSLSGHLYILQTPLFRVRNKKKTIYCYSEQERVNALDELGKQAEITRFKGLGEISPDEFKHFIGDDIRLDPVMLDRNMTIDELLSFYMGKNTPKRQEFIIDNLKVELDKIEQ